MNKSQIDGIIKALSKVILTKRKPKRRSTVGKRKRIIKGGAVPLYEPIGRGSSILVFYTRPDGSVDVGQRDELGTRNYPHANDVVDYVYYNDALTYIRPGLLPQNIQVLIFQYGFQNGAVHHLPPGVNVCCAIM